jgi:hypothetical protein
MAKSRKQRKSQKRRGGGFFDLFSSKPAAAPANVNKQANAAVAAPITNAVKPANVSVNNSKKNNSMKNNATTQLSQSATSQMGGMQLNPAPVNYKSPMFFPTEKTMQWATTAGIPTPKGMQGGRRTRRQRRNRKSKRSQRK